MAMVLIASEGMPIPSPTPSAIMSDRLNPRLGSSPLLSDGVDVCRVPVPVALVLVLGREVVVVRNTQVNDELQ